MKYSPRLFLTGTLALCFTCKVGAAELSYPEILLDDVKHVVTAPTRWENVEWHKAGLATLAVVGTALAIDRPLRDEMRRHSGDNTFITQVERFGSQYSAGVVGGFYVFGALTDDETSIQIAQDGIAASLIASGIVTPAIKLVSGRSRPRADEGIYHFKPFSETNSSFPSGHTTEAFALASVVANHYDKTWVSYTSYSIAGLVGFARTYHHAHFASDVLAGAMIGTLVGKSVVAHNADLRSGKLLLLPDVGRGLIGIRIAGSF
ncbi:MAG: phosphatase PAP2 family protein [Nitrosomonadales bacterium]|nr:phosphatase PAP2 family protein [Nitrosomonadales bacterium]